MRTRRRTRVPVTKSIAHLTNGLTRFVQVTLLLCLVLTGVALDQEVPQHDSPPILIEGAYCYISFGIMPD